MIDSTRLEQIGIKFDKKLFIEDVSDDLQIQMIKLRLMAAVNEFDDPKDRNELLELADKVEDIWNSTLTFIHG